MQYYVDDKTPKFKNLGDYKKTGNADAGAVTFKVENWKADDKIWNFNDMYGIFKLNFGGTNTF